MFLSMSDDVKREGFLLITTAVIVRHNRTHIRNSGPKGRRFKSCHLDQKKAGNRKVSGSFLSLLHKTPSLALFSCNECATMRKGPKTMSCRAHHFTPNHIIFVPLPIFRPDKKRNNAKPLDKTNIICKNRIRFYDRRVKPLDYQI